MANEYCWYCAHGTKKGGSHVYCTIFHEWKNKWDTCNRFAREYSRSSAPMSGVLGFFLILLLLIK